MDSTTILSLGLLAACGCACWLYAKWIRAEHRDWKRLNDLPPVSRSWLTEQETRRRG